MPNKVSSVVGEIWHPLTWLNQSKTFWVNERFFVIWSKTQTKLFHFASKNFELSPSVLFHVLSKKGGRFCFYELIPSRYKIAKVPRASETRLS